MNDGGHRGGYNKYNNRGGNRGNYRGGNRGGNRGGHRGGNNQYPNQNRQNQQQFGNKPQQQMGMPNAQVAQPTPQGQQPGMQLLALPQVNMAQFDQLQGEDKSNFVGNSIYGIIQGKFGDEFAPRITGMLLDEKVIDFKQLLTDAQYFTVKVNEAY